MPVVSIVIPMYNSDKYIESCLTSLLRSTFEDFEVLVVDDGSTDDSVSLIKPFLQDRRARLLQNPSNLGVAAARNLGIEAAAGRYIAFCDSDDIWGPEKLKRQITSMQVEDAAVSHTSVYYLKSDRQILMPAKKRITWDEMKIRNWIPNSSGVYDTHKVGKIYQKPFRHEDYEMWCDVLKVGGFSVGVDKPLVLINRRKGSVSANKFKSLGWHIQAQRRIFELSYPAMFYCMFQNVVSRIRERLWPETTTPKGAQ